MNRVTLFSLAIVLGLAATSCSAITDFDEPKDAGPDAGWLYSINNNLTATVAVTIAGMDGELILQLTEPLPEASDAELIAMLEDGTIGLNVLNEVTSVSFNLTEGTYTETISVAGDYNISINADRTELTISFFNEIQGTQLHADGDYLATITVLSNSIFVEETFTRDVTVTGG